MGKVAEFTITESDLRKHAAEQGWVFREELNCTPPGLELLRPRSTPYTDKDFFANLIPKALVYERLGSNHGGITFTFDPATSRANYLETHR